MSAVPRKRRQLDVGRAPTEKAAPCWPCPDRSLPGEDTLVAQNLEMEALTHSLYAVYPKGT